MEKRNFLFVSLDALIGDIAWQIAKEGHNVKYYIDNPVEREVADGFVTKTDNWKKEVDWADVIVFDDVLGEGKKAQRLRDKGHNVIGGSAYSDKLEDNRSFGQEELKKAKIPIIPYQDFTSFDDAIAFVQEKPAKYVIKPSGEAQNKKMSLFVGEEDDGKDVIQVLDAYRQAWSKKIRTFQLQRKISGVEVAVGAFFNGSKFITPINVNFEHKKLFPGNIGPSTGEMGTTMFWSAPNKLFNSTLKKIEPKLRDEGYVGYIDLNCIVNNNGIFPLEFTSRFGYPTISIQQEGMITPIGEFFHDLAQGNNPKLKVKSGFQAGVRIVVPPFPFRDKKTFDVLSKDSVIIFRKPNYDGIHIEDVKLLNGEWVITGTSGVVLIVCGTGQTMLQAQKQVYSRINNVVIPYMYYRKDIGDRWVEDSDRLHNWGYLREV
ncbi:MAG: phosphoribosylamine--glycine ligase [Candidatus Aenigmarchaeota archaeon]|nr:phosphoribosylamine--glycine ligase [Candidatus Aenigmarchaeota archaeon]